MDEQPDYPPRDYLGFHKFYAREFLISKDEDGPEYYDLRVELEELRKKAAEVDSLKERVGDLEVKLQKSMADVDRLIDRVQFINEVLRVD